MSEQIILHYIQFTAMLFLYCSLCISVLLGLYLRMFDSQSIYADLKDYLVHCWLLP